MPPAEVAWLAAGSLWGFCDACERWHCRDDWYRDTGEATCAICGARPSVLEEFVDGRRVVRLDLVLVAHDVSGPAPRYPGRA